MESRRASGLLLHITSLPSAYGIGDLGPEAYAFADFLTRTHQRIWQMLPLGPVGYGASPYSSLSTFAGNPLLISPAPLLEAGLLDAEDVAPLEELPREHVDYARLIPRKKAVLKTAYENFRRGEGAVDPADLDRFWSENDDWLDDYALYAALKADHDGAPWTDWDPDLVHRDSEALDAARDRLEDECRMHAFWQLLFQRQWRALQSYCHARDIRLFGDIPIYVAHDSADVWANQDRFFLDDDGEPTVVAGVPPDYFSPQGQRWGNPIYRWDRMEQNDFQWWIRRMERVLDRVDLVRLDHFRGFEAFWQIPAEEETAVNGEWVDGPGDAIFHALRDALGDVPVIAEDLGIITDEVRALRDRFDFPGMAVLQFAFENDASNAFLPHNYQETLVAYTGTHDNNTLCGWWENDVSENGREYATEYLDLEHADAGVHERALRFLMASVADRVITPLQDVLGLDESARMNIPGDTTDNWAWRFTPDQITDAATERLKTLTETYGRDGDIG